MCESNQRSPQLRDLTSAEEALFGSVLSFYAHRDQLMWSRTQIVIAVQAATLGGSYNLGSGDLFLAVSVLLLGATLSVIAILMMARDQELREANAPLLRELGQRLSTKAGLSRDREFRLGTSGPIRASFLAFSVTAMFVVVDALYATLLCANAGLVLATSVS
jgi:hypothetical protein